ncbi:glycosyltransferase family 1 protein [Gracilibacillus sp. YIM 98692]|uniref:glycosyltransferase family 4 protein n=1 Tax=Gracilibacillus sp. YIM 98692 TaxID=2663532 RepID=UPI0013D0103A|nr:glycosyltransferase family 1 protein [Gracilibacillus sp. YIM 98692]
MKIAIFTDTYLPDVNGVAKTLGRLTHYLDSTNHSYIVIAPKQTKTNVQNAQFYPQSSFPFPLYRECRVSVPNTIYIRELLKSFQPDIIHIATPFSIGLCGLHLSKKLNIPLVGSYHTDFDHYLEYYHLSLLSKPLWLYMEWFHQSMSRLFVPSTFTYQQLKKRNFHHIQVWKRGVDMDVFHPNYVKGAICEKYNISKKYVISYVGRLAPEKNVDTLRYIFHNLPPSIANHVQWVIVGDGPSKEWLQANTLPNTVFTGFLPQEEVAKVVGMSDLFVFPSETETFGNVVLEALACGTPVITANAGGVKNIIQEGFTGILCEQGQQRPYLEAIVSILYNDNWRYQLEQNAIRYAQKQRWEDRFEELLTAYQDVIEEKAKTKKHA